MLKVLFLSFFLISQGVAMNNIQSFEDDLPPAEPKPKPKPDVPG